MYGYFEPCGVSARQAVAITVRSPELLMKVLEAEGSEVRGGTLLQINMEVERSRSEAYYLSSMVISSCYFGSLKGVSKSV